MNRLLLLMAVLIGLASIAGPTLASAVATAGFPTEVGQELCSFGDAVQYKAPAFKPCSKKINGQAISCQQPVALLPVSCGYSLEPVPCVFDALRDSAPTAPGDGRQFRPPRAA